MDPRLNWRNFTDPNQRARAQFRHVVALIPPHRTGMRMRASRAYSRRLERIYEEAISK